MKIKTLTGPSIQAALAEARRLLGDDVVLLESVPPRGDAPARITVMVDTSAPALPPPRPRMLSATGSAAASGSAAAGGASDALARLRSAAVMEEAAVGVAEVSVARGGYGNARQLYAAPPSHIAPVAQPSGFGAAPNVEPRRRGTLFPARQEGPQVAAAVPTAVPADALSERMEAQFQMLTDKIKQLEGALGETVIGASMQWAAHPLFSHLLKKGMRPASAARLFDRLAARGFTPDAETEQLRWALAQELRSSLDVAAPRHESTNLLLIGPSGAGKTSLALKLAKHPHFYGRRRTTVIFVLPEDSQTLGYHTPVELYRHFEIPVQTVKTADEMHQALDRVRGFDQVIIDTAPMPSREAEARKMLTHVRRVVSGVMPLQAQLVVNATRVLDGLTPAFLKSLPLRPDTVALTHLDEISGWGRIAEWLVAVGLPVRSISTGPRVPDGIAAFSPTWFVEEMLQR